MKLLGVGQLAFVMDVAPGNLSTLQWMPATHEHMGNTHWTLWIIKTNNNKHQAGRKFWKELGVKAGGEYNPNNLCEILKELITAGKKMYIQTSLK